MHWDITDTAPAWQFKLCFVLAACASALPVIPRILPTGSYLALPVVPAVLSAGCSPSLDDPLQANKDILHQFVDSPNEADWNALDGILAAELWIEMDKLAMFNQSGLSPVPTIGSERLRFICHLTVPRS